MKTIITVGLCLTLVLPGCSEKGADANGVIDMPRFKDARLSQGRSVWMGTCRNCHMLGIAGAPAVSDYKSWLPRIAKGEAALYQSALNGVLNAKGEDAMPPRGGNTRLTADQVRQAVDYMVAAVKRLHADS